MENLFKILIVDDAPINMEVVSNILQDEGYHLSFAENGTSALNQIRDEHFDLILLDIIMPGINGFEVCRRLRENPDTRYMPVLFLTSISDTESVVEGFEVGAMDYVTKPFNETELLARVKTHLELNRSREKLRKINTRLYKEIAERKQAERRYREMYENAVQGMFQSTLSGRILSANPAYIRILGYDSIEEVLSIRDVTRKIYKHPEDRGKMIRMLKEKGVITNYEVNIRRRDGASAWLLMNARLAEDADGDLFIEGIATDGTARKLAEEELRRSETEFRYLAVHDNLTSLYNTRYLYQSLSEIIEKSSRDNASFSLIFMDMDNFKKVVDTYGHLNGSRALQEVAETIRETLTRPAYGVAYGGDEFVIVLPSYDRDQAVKKAEEIRLRMSQTVYLSACGHNVKLRASFGISTYPQDADDMTGLLTAADKAMFGIKEKGKDAVSSGI
ncbi:diguanylate cyclase [Desulfococcaceae bacterium HSG8]|nr:diguanylate cyclase [Desulfococcaceae bacterium HSG8]